MSSDREAAFEATLKRIGWLLGGLLLLMVAVSVMMMRGGSAEFVDRKGQAWMLIEGETYILDDRDEDGAIDCLLKTGLLGTRYQAAGYDGRCGRNRPGSPRPMSAEMREALGRLADDKLALKATHMSCVDLGGDLRADCVVNAHNPKVVLYRSDDGRCPGSGGEAMDTNRAQAFDRVLAQEERIREWVRLDNAEGTGE